MPLSQLFHLNSKQWFMGYNVNYNKEEDVMEITLQGHFNFREIIKADFAVNEAAKNNNVARLLIDLTLALLDANRTELFELPSSFYTKWRMNPATRIALIEPLDKDAKGKAEFYIFASQNLGWFTNMFPNRKKALKWLQAK